MNILLTGATGFIGKELLRQLAMTAGWKKIVCLSRYASFDNYGKVPDDRQIAWWPVDLNVRGEVRNAMRDFRPDLVFHLAADSSVARCGVSGVNVDGTYHLLAACEKPTKFVYASSATVYGDRYNANEADALDPTSEYGWTKCAAEGLVRLFGKGVVSWVNLRLVANAGRGATHGLVRDVVEKLKSPSSSLHLIGAGPGTTKPFLHVSDAARAFVHFGLFNNYQGNVNVSTEHELSVESVAHHAMQVTGVRKPIAWHPEDAWAGDNKRVKIDTSLATRLGWKAALDSVSAVRQAAEELWRGC